MTTGIKVGDLVLISAAGNIKPPANSMRGVVMSKIDESWFRVYSSYWTSLGEKTNIQDFPETMLKKVYENEGG